jgi:hypothetical protein
MEFSLAPFWGGPFSHLEILITAGWSRAFIEAAGREHSSRPLVAPLGPQWCHQGAGP